MNLRNYKVCFCYATCLCLFFLAEFTYAQTMSLDSVAKIEFIDRGYILSRQYDRLEVIPENGIWKCYQTELRDESFDGKKDNTNRVFIKNVSVKDMAALVVSITTIDTGLHIKQFDINANNLVHHIDSLYPDLKPKQRQTFEKAIRSKELIEEAAYRALRFPMLMDDLSHYFIVITAKSGCKITAHARSYYLYGFPWDIDGVKNYNPNIAITFHAVFGNDAYCISEAKRLDLEVVRGMYTHDFEAKFSFDNVKTDYPTAYKILGNTFVPVSFRFDKTGYGWGTFKSKLLPENIRLLTTLYLYDTLLLKRTKRFEDTVARLIKKKNFLFDFLKTRTDCQIIFAPDLALQRKKEAYNLIKGIFPGMVDYDYRKIQEVEITGNAEMESKWLLLPDNTLVLYQFKGAPQADKIHIKLLNISPAIMNRPFGKYQYSACVVFDVTGKVIHDYGLPKGYLY